jgi:hypothetical protein
MVLAVVSSRIAMKSMTIEEDTGEAAEGAAEGEEPQASGAEEESENEE